MTELPVLGPHVTAAALQGSFCPKMCTFACPVEAATGRDDAVPWSFHRAVTDLAEGRRSPEELAPDLVACTGCLACREPCAFDQDVPDQVRAGRAVARPHTPAAEAALAHIAAGDRPDGTAAAHDAVRQVAAGATVLHAGCQDPAEVVAAAARLLVAAGHEVTVVADGCCGQLAHDLGGVEVAEARARHRATQLDTAGSIVSLDPHCAPALPAGASITDLWTLLADAELGWRTDDAGTAAYHDPCVLARGAGVVDPPRQLLARAGVEVVEPEFHGTATACSGAGMGLALLDPEAADATGQRRAGHLAATGADRTVTACSRAAERLRAVGQPTDDLAVLLAARLTEAP